MFQSTEIAILKSNYEFMEKEQARLLNRIRDNENDLELLAKHLGVKLESVNKRQVVPLTEVDKVILNATEHIASGK